MGKEVSYNDMNVMDFFWKIWSPNISRHNKLWTKSNSDV